jgi:hypothetical protein
MTIPNHEKLKGVVKVRWEGNLVCINRKAHAIITEVSCPIPGNDGQHWANNLNSSFWRIAIATINS